MSNYPGRPKILVAEDDPVTRRILQFNLEKWGYTTVVTANGVEAWQVLTGDAPPSVAILDWLMPEMEGLELSRKIRENPATASTYVILLTSRANQGDSILGLEAGADEYVTKPFELDELRARVRAGARVVQLQARLAERVRELETALAKVKLLQGLLPICSYCTRIRNDRNYWQQVEGYISEHSEVVFSHGICPDCYRDVVKPELAKLNPPGEEL